VFDSVRARAGTFLLSLRWHPDDSLRGAKRDSAVRYNLARADHDIDRTADGFKKKYTWTNIYGFLSHARIADPDSDRQYGRLISVDTLHVDEFDPPFKFPQRQGEVRHLGDSVWFEARHFDLPASTGGGGGKVVWGSNLPCGTTLPCGATRSPSTTSIGCIRISRGPVAAP
jgi:translocation and assembly module TamB